MDNPTSAILEHPIEVGRVAPYARLTRMVTARRLAFAAASLGLAYAAISVVWGLGGTWLLDTVGGELASGGRAGASLVIFALWAAIVLKLIASVLPLLAVSAAVNPRFHKPIRLLCGVEAFILTTYGLVLSIGGLLVHFGVIEATTDADHRAIAWHAFLWDPWFATWGILVTMTLLLSRPSTANVVYLPDHDLPPHQ